MLSLTCSEVYISIYLYDIIFLLVALECYHIMPILAHHKHVSRLVTVYITTHAAMKAAYYHHYKIIVFDVVFILRCQN